MIVKLPLMSAEARGAIGGLVYNTWRGKNVVKINTSPTGQGTEKRLAAQAILSAVSKLWAGLTDQQRAAWSQYAIDHPVTNWTGSPGRNTGMNWFCKCNVELSRFSIATISDPPVVAAPSPLTGLVLSIDAADIKISWDYPPPAGGMAEAFGVGPLSKGVSARLEQCQYVTAFGTGPPPPHVIWAGAAVGRYTVFARNIDIATGLVSTWTSDFLDYVAP